MTSSTEYDWMREGFDPNRLGHHNVAPAVDFLLDRCPVARGVDSRGDYYVFAKHSAVLRVMQDWQNFEVGREVRIGVEPFPLTMPPLDTNPPLHRQFRTIINPWLSPKKVAEYEPKARAIISEFLDGIPRDPFDIAARVFQPLPPVLTFRLLMHVQEEVLERARGWVEETLFGSQDHDVTESNTAFVKWLFAFVAERRAAGRHDDVVDALVHGTVEDGRSLSDEEVAGAVMVLLFGGFETTTNASSSFLVRLLEDHELMQRLRDHPEDIEAAIEEHLRLVPPVDLVPRRCTADVEIDGVALKAGQRVAYLVDAANRDPAEYDDPLDFRVGRAKNRSLVFGGGVHRCVGSHFARMVLRVEFEEILARFGDISLAPDSSVTWDDKGMSVWHVARSVPVVMTPKHG
ncbi:cytochrome P450 [Mycobacterium sp. EPa45]|uniref:cytochrome P450 n=1 Tax=Mycobacterium sp. EPa45 TaxID=1545728 RepID=UPI00069C8FB5|nr:cytochrome P450 [Mycobacterium sp. EPa45]